MSNMTDAEEMYVTHIENWLRNKGVTLWMNWCLTSEDSLREAAEWWYRETLEWADWRMETSWWNRNEKVGVGSHGEEN